MKTATKRRSCAGALHILALAVVCALVPSVGTAQIPGGGNNFSDWKDAAKAISEAKKVEAADLADQMKLELERLKNKEAIRNPYDRGAPEGDAMKNWIDDLMTVVGAFGQCWQPFPVGLCIEPEYPWDIDLFWEYFLPVQKVENVDQPLKSGLFAKSWQSEVLDWLDSADSGTLYGYPDIAAITTAQSADLASASVAKYSGGGFGLGSLGTIGQMTEAPEGNQKVIDELKKLELDRRFRNMENVAGSQMSEYHLTSTLFEETVGSMIPFQCHNKRSGFRIFASDWPFIRLPATISLISYLFYPGEMKAIFGIPGARLLANPVACIGNNMNNYENGTPKDLFSGGTFNFNPMLYVDLQRGGNGGSADGNGCLGTNIGSWVPLTTWIPSALHASVAAMASTIRAFKAAKAFPFAGGQFYTTTLPFERGDEYQDMWQYLHSDAAKEATDKTCFNLYDYEHKEKVTQWSGMGGDPDVFKRDPGFKDRHDWNVIAQWKYFRCCPDGYVPLIVWKGDDTEIKD